MIVFGVVAGGIAILAVGLVFWWFGPWPGPPPPEEAEQASLALEARMIEALKPLHLIPVVVPRGQAIGDVYSVDRGTWVRAGSECFGPIEATRSGRSDLPSAMLEGDRALGAALGIGYFLGATGAAGATHGFLLRYEDVAFEGVSEGQMRASLRGEACPELAPMLNGTAPNGAERLLVVGEVFRAARTVEYRIGDTSEAKVEVAAKLAAAERLGIKLNAKVDGDQAGSAKVVLSTAAASVVAVRPAFVPVVNVSLGPSGTGPADMPSVAWEAFDPEDVEHVEVFDALMEIVRTAVEKRRAALREAP